MEADKVEIFLRNFMSAWQMAKIYELKHPKFIDSLSLAEVSLQSVLDEKRELTIGVFGTELASAEEVFFDFSKKIGPAIEQLRQRGIERITFQRGITKEELAKFISFLINPPVTTKDEVRDYLPLIGIKNILVGKIKDAQVEPLDYHKETREQIAYYQNCLDRIDQSLNALLSEGVLDNLKIQFITNNIMENLLGNYQVFLKLSQVKSHDSATFMHLLNVSILSVYFSQKLRFSRDDCLNVGVAALFHDIGKLYITRRIIQKKGELNRDEFTKIKSHTILGAEILLRHSDSLSFLPAVVAFEHHLGYDLKGYPKLKFWRRPHIASSIVHICDEYDALIQKRSYKRDYPPETVYKIMMRQRGSKFSPELLDTFFKIIGIWPRGTIILLNDARVAIVRDINEDDLFRPKVEIVSSSPRQIIDLHTKSELSIQRSLNPLREGRQYLDLV